MGQAITAQLPDAPFSEDPVEPTLSVLDVNLTGAYYTIYLALHYFRTHPSSTSTKQLVIISSMLAYIEAPLVLDYNASKHAVRGMWRSLCGEQTALGIKGVFRTNLLAPNLVKTPMTKDFVKWMEEDRGFAVAEISDLVGAFVRVVSDEGINGRAIGVFSDNVAVDLCDDFEGHDGGREALKLVESGLLGSGPSKWGRYRMMD